MTGAWFVWLATGRRAQPEPQVWRVEGLASDRFLARHEITPAELLLTVDELAKRYPPPEVQEPSS